MASCPPPLPLLPQLIADSEKKMKKNMESYVNSKCRHLLQKDSIPSSPPPPPPPVSQHTPSVELSEEFIQSLIDAALAKYSADRIAKFDYALDSAGGSVVDSSPTYDPSETQPKIFGFTLPFSLSNSNPNIIIQVRD